MVNENTLCVGILCAVVPIALCFLRLITILPALRANKEPKLSRNSGIFPGAKLMILLGSGGHTGEMLRLVENTNVAECSRTWLVSSGDNASLVKAKNFEESLGAKNFADVHYAELYRARKVKEPLISSVMSTVKSIYSTAQQLRHLPHPDILLVNGPGTSVPVAYLLFTMKLLGLCKTRIIYVESLARVHSLSLSGRLILPIANRFLVQWTPLAAKYKRAEYYGILI
ncbi:hypothetical protein JCM33374_g5654 [Metschnikowia sp. JCM 33374]|nr:hypothetical protein JCM33374_g5654 [Metschnikowia sp. JCM 33374]